MTSSLPSITSRRFPLYWGTISFAVSLILTLLVWMVQMAPYLLIIYPFCSNAVPLILLKSDLKWKQQIIWISGQYISSLVVVFAQFCILPLRSKSDPPGYSPEIVYNSSTYSILAIAITIWIIASLIQLWSISFKHPKRWLIFNVLTFGVSLIFMIWPHTHINYK